MMQSVDLACEEGEPAFKKAKLNHSSNSSRSGKTKILPTKPVFCIHTSLRKLYEEERAKDPNSNKSTGLKRTSHLLEKLVAQERLNTAILNLYPGNKGYSFAFEKYSAEMGPSSSSTILEDTPDMLETKQWPYEYQELLRCIDNEELPAFLSDIFESEFSYLFYSGCVILQVRDYRQSYPHSKCDIHHVLLKPSLRSILADLNMIMEDKDCEDKDWSLQEKQLLESQILAANHPVLCLEPSIKICETQTKLNHTFQLLNTHRLRQTAKKFSQASVNRKRKHDQLCQTPGMELLDYLTNTRNTPKTAVTVSSASLNKISKKAPNGIKSIPVPNLQVSSITPPCDNVLETEPLSKVKGLPRIFHIKLSFQQRPNLEYLGELYLDRDYKKGEKTGVVCQFSLGCRADVARCVQQFVEVFTEGGRNAVSIKCTRNPMFANQNSELEAITPLNNLSKQLALQKTIQVSTIKGLLGSGVLSLMQDNSILPNCSAVMQTQNNHSNPSTSEVEFNALTKKFMKSVQQFQATAKQQKKLSAVGNNAAIINLLNSSPASNLNSDTSAAVIKAINNAALPQQIQTINNKVLGSKMSIRNLSNGQMLNSNLITVNNSTRKVSLVRDSKGQTICLKASNSNFQQSTFSSVPIKHLVNQRVKENTSALSAMLVGTPAADRPDIVGPNTSSLLLEKLGAGSMIASPSPSMTTFIQNTKHYTVQSSKSILSPLSSPPPQKHPTLQNLQVQLPGFAQPISLSLNVSSGTTVQSHHGGIFVSMPATATSTSNVRRSASTLVTPVSSSSTVVVTKAGKAQLLTPSAQGFTQKNIRPTPATGITLSNGSHHYQLVRPVQRRRLRQNSISQNISTHGLQRIPRIIKMATHNTTSHQAMLPSNTSVNAVTQQIQIQHLQITHQTQVSDQPYQQISLNQQQKFTRRLIRSSSTSDSQQ